MKRAGRYMLKNFWLIILIGLVSYWIIDDKISSKRYSPRKEAGKQVLRVEDSSYVVTTTIDSVYYDPDYGDKPVRN